MSDTISGIAAMAALALIVVAPIALALHRRPPEEVVTTGSARGRAGMAIHPWRGHRASSPVSWVLAAGVTALGLYFLGSSAYAAAVFIGAGLYLLYLLWARTTGRAGDGTLTLTPEGLHQLHAGSEVFVPWDAVRGLVTTPRNSSSRRPDPWSPSTACRHGWGGAAS